MNSRYPAASVLLNKLSLDMRKSLHKMQAYHTEEQTYQIMSSANATANKAKAANLVNFSRFPSTERPLFFCQ